MTVVAPRLWRRSPINNFRDEFIDSVLACDRDTHTTLPASRKSL